MKRIAYTVAATKQRRKLAADVRDRLAGKLASYAETGTGDVRALVGRPGARLRIGDWRIVFVETTDEILAVAIGHRREIYD